MKQSRATALTTQRRTSSSSGGAATRQPSLPLTNNPALALGPCPRTNDRMYSSSHSLSSADLTWDSG